MRHDLIIVGGGPIGATLACAARGLSVGLVSHAPRLPRSSLPEAFDARVYAMSPANVAFLEDLGVWQGVPQDRLAPVHAMRIAGDRGRSCIEFDAYSAGVPALAWIVEDGTLQDALWRALERRDDLTAYAPAQCETLEFEPAAARLKLRDGRELAGKLVVGADGADSFVRAAAGIDSVARDYGQSAVVANFHCGKPHGGTAYQWFQGGPVLALLPLPGERVSMVWSLPTAEAERVGRLDSRSLCAEVEQASGHALGALELAGAPRTYRLQRRSARRLVAPRVALAGDASHVIHPLAGQGLNLGLQDVRSLAATLAGREPLRDPGELGLLRRYERSRAEPILAMEAMVDGLFRLFASESGTLSRLRNAGLNLTDRVQVLKNLLIRHAMN